MSQTAARAGQPYMQVTPLSGTAGNGDRDYSVTFYDAEGHPVGRPVIVRNAEIELNDSDRLSSFTVSNWGGRTTIEQGTDGRLVLSTGTGENRRTATGADAISILADRMNNHDDSVGSVLDRRTRQATADQRETDRKASEQRRDNFNPDAVDGINENPFQGSGNDREVVYANQGNHTVSLVARSGLGNTIDAAYRVQRLPDGTVVESFARPGHAENRDFFVMTTGPNGSPTAKLYTYDPSMVNAGSTAHGGYRVRNATIEEARAARDSNLSTLRNDTSMINSYFDPSHLITGSGGQLHDVVEGLRSRGLNLQEVVFGENSPGVAQQPIRDRLARVDNAAHDRGLLR